MFRTSGSPITFLNALVQGRRAASQFRGVENFVMFIGQPRSGTSLIGSLLNSHRHMMVAQELNILKYVRRGYVRKQLFWLIQENERAFSEGGRRWTGYQYKVDSPWQGNCDSLRVIGDKKAGRTTEELEKHPSLLARLELTIRVPVRIVHVVRNPFNVISTIHRKVRNAPLEAVAEMYFSRCETNWRLMQERADQIHSFRLEDFVHDPKQHLAALCGHVKLVADDEYVDACSKVVFAKPKNTMSQVVWPDRLIESVAERMRSYPFLAGYEYSRRAAA